MKTRSHLTEEEYEGIMHELDTFQGNQHNPGSTAATYASTTQQMVLMIFKFYVDSGEQAFFIKRLKNVATGSSTPNLMPRKQ